jgi:hypothetical protein
MDYSTDPISNPGEWDRAPYEHHPCDEIELIAGGYGTRVSREVSRVGERRVGAGNGTSSAILSLERIG